MVGLLAVVGAAISLTGSWIPSFWGDEAASVMSASRSIPSLLWMLGAVDGVHGTYYLALHWWISLVGASPFAVRLPSALAIGATVAAVTLITRQLSTTRVAVAAGLICAVLPRVTYMGAEARSYAFSAAIAAWLTYLLVVMLRQRAPHRALWIAYAALLCLGTYVFLYTALLAVAHAVILASVRIGGPFLVRWATSVAAAFVAALPVAVLAVLERGQVAFLAARDVTTFRKLFVSLWFGDPLFAFVAWALIALCGIAAIGARRSGKAGGVIRDERGPRLDVVAVSWLLVPAVILIGGHFLVPVYAARYLSFCAPAAAMLMALGVSWLARGNRWMMALVVLLTWGSAVPAYLAQRGPHAKNNSDWNATSEIIAAHAHPGDAIDFDESVRPSRRPRLAMHVYPEAFAGLRDVTLDVPFSQLASWHDSTITIREASTRGRLAAVRRVWLIEYSTPAGIDTYDRADLEKLGFRVVHEYTTHRSVIYEYVMAD